MSKLPKELLRDYVRTQNFTSTEEVLAAMKEMFKDVVQEVLEAEMDDYLGYDKYEVSEKKVTNSRNGYSKKTIKSELGEVELVVPRDRVGELTEKLKRLSVVNEDNEELLEMVGVMVGMVKTLKG